MPVSSMIGPSGSGGEGQLMGGGAVGATAPRPAPCCCAARTTSAGATIVATINKWIFISISSSTAGLKTCATFFVAQDFSPAHTKNGWSFRNGGSIVTWVRRAEVHARAVAHHRLAVPESCGPRRHDFDLVSK